MYEAVIGLEVHAQLLTNSKIFATSATTAGKEPNTLTDPVTLGLPGCLPVLNKKVVEFAIKLGLATDCQIAEESIFARKHYFYPDLPKGYQISQYEKPICEHGKLEVRVNGEKKTIGITRIHLEEDAGKNIHLESENNSIVDLNRAGVPLVEIVSEPDIRSSKEAGAYVRQLRQIVRYLDVCDGNMEEGSLRCDANVSIREKGASEFGQKVEIKNLNSFRFIEKAIDFEIERQIDCLENGEEIVQETRLWDEKTNSTRSMRSKEFAADYRYFPDPDLPPLHVDEDWIDKVRDSLPELPAAAYKKLKDMYKLDEHQCDVLTEEKITYAYFNQAIHEHDNPKNIASWITTELFGKLNREGVDLSNCPISPEHLAHLVKLIDEDVISGKIAKTVFDEMFESGQDPKSIIEQKGLKQISNPDEIRKLVKSILAANPQVVEDYKAGKTKMFGFFVGQIMKESGGKVNPKLANDILKEELA